MTGTRRAVALGFGVAVLGVACGLAAQQSTVPQGKSSTIADTLVNRCAGIRQDDLVIIRGGTEEQQLLEDLAIEVRKLGAHPLLSFGSERLLEKLCTQVPERFDAQTPALEMKLAESIDAIIAVEVPHRPDLFAGISGKRLAAREKAQEPIYATMLKRGVVQVHLGNGLYPSEALARQYGLKKEELAKLFWDGVNTDAQRLQAVGEKVRAALTSGREVRITAPNGTDLTVGIERRPVFVSDGVISSDDRYAGGPSCQVWLPAGEVYLVPVAGTAKGTFIADDFFYQGQRIEKLELRFDRGLMTSMKAKGDIKALEERYQAAPTGRDVFAAIDIGINPAVTVPKQSRLVTWMGAGAITVGVGNNVWAGGENNVPFDLFAHLTTATLAIDGKKIVENGRLLTE